MSRTEVSPLKPAAAEGLSSSLEARLAVLAEQVQHLEVRVSALESSAPEPAGTPVVLALESHPTLPTPPALPSPAHFVGLIGRVCLILGGATFIRALVDAGTLPRGWGMALGLAYALSWALLADRGKHPLDSAFHALASILIAYPLIVESTTRFGILAPGPAALLLLAVTGLHGAVAWRRDLQPIIWIATLASLGAGFAMMAIRQAIEPFAAAFLLLGVAALWLTYGRRWHGLRWPTALAADLGVLILALLAAWPGGPPEAYRGISPDRAMALALALAALYIGSFAGRMLQRRRVINAFESVQTAIVLLVGFGGAVRIALTSGSGAALLGGGVSLAGVGCYAAAAPFAEDQEETRANFNFFTFLALIFLLLGGPIVLPQPLFAVFSGALGLAAMVAGLRLRRAVLILQGAIYLIASSVASGLALWSLRAFLDPAGAAARLPLAGFASLAALAASLALFLLRRPPDSIAARMRAPVLVLGALTAAGFGALTIWGCCRALARGAPDPGTLAVARTGVLSALAIALAWLGRRLPVLELRWLVYPMLVLTALKFLFEDLAVGRPLTLFLAFMFFGTTLILAPRLLKVNR
ncbi:hypothetical protein [Geothrix sp.]|jgi:hypothetical protein|uniref:hypothetical protein n=1 Tax=Geothrix sp. TaxID=1962974 RepID=UPI0025BDD605|nr:hypothetical protein [Geothrix sp.]